MIEQIQTPTPGFEEAIRAHFYLKKDLIIAQCEVDLFSSFFFLVIVGLLIFLTILAMEKRKSNQTNG